MLENIAVNFPNIGRIDVRFLQYFWQIILKNGRQDDYIIIIAILIQICKINLI